MHIVLVRHDNEFHHAEAVVGKDKEKPEGNSDKLPV